LFEKALASLLWGTSYPKQSERKTGEVDIHDLQKEEDERREKVLSVMGQRVVCFGNDEVVREVSAVVGKIKEMILTKQS
jgi:very-short-patch-repair endonuclease